MSKVLSDNMFEKLESAFNHADTSPWPEYELGTEFGPNYRSSYPVVRRRSDGVIMHNFNVTHNGYNWKVEEK